MSLCSMQERDRMKKLMAQEETMVPNLFFNLRRALTPLMHDATYAAMNEVSQLIEKASYNPKNRTAAKGGIDGNVSSKRTSTEVVASSASPLLNIKRTKVTGDIEGGVAMEGNECSDGEGETSDQLGACGTDGGYCPPCYELA